MYEKNIIACVIEFWNEETRNMKRVCKSTREIRARALGVGSSVKSKVNRSTRDFMCKMYQPSVMSFLYYRSRIMNLHCNRNLPFMDPPQVQFQFQLHFFFDLNGAAKWGKSCHPAAYRGQFSNRIWIGEKAHILPRCCTAPPDSSCNICFFLVFLQIDVGNFFSCLLKIHSNKLYILVFSQDKTRNQFCNQYTLCVCVSNCKKNSKRRNVVSIDSCLNNVTQNDAWCFSNRLAGYHSRVAVMHVLCQHTNNRQSISRDAFILSACSLGFLRRCITLTLLFTIDVVHCTRKSKDCCRRATNNYNISAPKKQTNWRMSYTQYKQRSVCVFIWTCQRFKCRVYSLPICFLFFGWILEKKFMTHSFNYSKEHFNDWTI